MRTGTECGAFTGRSRGKVDSKYAEERPVLGLVEVLGSDLLSHWESGRAEFLNHGALAGLSAQGGGSPTSNFQLGQALAAGVLSDLPHYG